MNNNVSKHMPLAIRLLNKGLRKTEVDAGVQGTAPGEPPAFYGGCQFYFDSIQALADVWGPAAKERQAHIPRYTDAAPVIQFNRLKLSDYGRVRRQTCPRKRPVVRRLVTSTV